MAGPFDDSVFAGSAPWNQWGNTQQLQVAGAPFFNPNSTDKQITLCRVQYNRPETWRWLVSAKILQAPSTIPGGEQANISVWFELLTGIGRSMQRIPFWITLPSWDWSGGFNAPANVVNWTTMAEQTISQVFIADTPTLTTSRVLTDLIVGQDMTLVAHASFTTNLPDPVTPALVEVSAQFAPNVHVRPDWFQLDASPPEQFAGGEVKGR